MSEKQVSVVIEKDDILKLLIEAFKTGVTSYYELAEATCVELLENYVIEKSKLDANITVKLSSPKNETSNYPEWNSRFTNSTNTFINSGLNSSELTTILPNGNVSVISGSEFIEINGSLAHFVREQ
jgi:hypothetical protein